MSCCHLANFDIFLRWNINLMRFHLWKPMFNMFHIVPLMDMCCSSGFSACLTLVVATTLVTIPMVKKMSKNRRRDVRSCHGLAVWNISRISLQDARSPIHAMVHISLLWIVTNGDTPARWLIQLSQETFWAFSCLSENATCQVEKYLNPTNRNIGKYIYIYMWHVPNVFLQSIPILVATTSLVLGDSKPSNSASRVPHLWQLFHHQKGLSGSLFLDP